MLLWLCKVETFVLCSYATHLQGMSLVRAVSTVYYPQTAQAFYTFWILSLKCFKQLCRKDLVLKPVCLMDSGKDVELKVHVLQVIHFTVNCLHQCGCWCELAQKMSEKENGAFDEEWLHLGAEDVHCIS